MDEAEGPPMPGAGAAPPTRLALVLALALVLGLVGCTYQGPQHDSPLTRRFTWYSYLNGDDLRAACVPGAPPRYRLVYNGVYVQQVRSYDIQPAATAAPAAPGGGPGTASASPPGRVAEPGVATLRARVIGPVQLNEVGIRPQFSTVIEDLSAPWAGDIASRPLAGEDLAALDRALAASGFMDPAPKGLTLRGEDFFWIGVACIDGAIHFHAYKWPQPAFERATFPALLLGWDPTGVPINPPRTLSTFDIYHSPATDPGVGPSYTLTIGDNGLAGTRPLF